MKSKFLFIILFLIIAPLFIHAATLPVITERLQYDRGNRELFRGNELSVDLFGGYLSPHTSASKLGIPTLRRGEWGAGVGVNYFFTRNLGLAADAHFVDYDRGSFIDTMSLSLLLRLPLDQYRVAPYVFAGGGRWTDGGLWTAHVGAGLEFRFHPQFGIFADTRFTVLESGGDFQLVRFGLRVGF